MKPPDRLIEECGRCCARRTERSAAAGRGGSNWWKPWATGPWRVDGTTHSITVTHAHTRLCQRSSPENTLGTLWSRRHLENDSRGGRETSIPINVHSLEWPRTDLGAHRRQSFWWGGTLKTFGSNVKISRRITIWRYEITLMMCRALGTKKLFMSSFQGFKWIFPPAVLMQHWLWSHSGGYKNVLEQKRNNLFFPISLLFEKIWLVLHFRMIIVTDCGEWIASDLWPGFFSFCDSFVCAIEVADRQQTQSLYYFHMSFMQIQSFFCNLTLMPS